MKVIVTVLLVAAAFASAEPQRSSSRQTADDGSYTPSGWKPNGPLLQLPTRNNNVQAYGPPRTIYGPPSTESDIETTTDSVTEPTTVEPEAETLKESLTSAKLQSTKSEKSTAPQNQFYFIIPRSEKLVLASPLTVNSKARRNQAPARLEQYPQVVQREQLVPAQFEQAQFEQAQFEQAAPAQFEQVAPVQFEQAVPVQFEQIQAIPYFSGYVSQSSILTPYSSSFVQIYQ